MGSDPLSSDDITTLLNAFPSEALEGVVGICRRHTSWSLFPADRAYDAHALKAGANFRPHAGAIARELIWWGSHDLGRQIGFAPTWRDIVSKVAQQLGVAAEDRTAGLPVWKIEQAAFRKAIEGWEKLSPEQRDEAMKKAGMDTNAARGGLGMAAGGLLRVLAARGGSAGLAAAAPFAAPIMAILGAGWLAYDLAGPGYRVLRPAVLTVAYVRQGLRDARSAGAFEE